MVELSLAGHDRRHRRLLVLGLVASIWVSLPPFLGPSVAVDRFTEIVDHPLPAIVVFVVVAMAAARREVVDEAWFANGIVILLAGMFVTGTHIPLVGVAMDGGVSWIAAVHHSLPGVVVLATGATWAWLHR